MCTYCKAKISKGCLSGPCCCSCECYICARSNLYSEWDMLFYYKPKYVCVGCKKVFKWFTPEISKHVEKSKGYIQKDLLSKLGGSIDNKRCPHCSEVATLVGPTFRAPKKSDTKEWIKVEKLINQNYEFTACPKM